jgi:ornithine cyclodeaminase
MSDDAGVLVLREREIQDLLDLDGTRAAVRDGFVRLARAEVALPGVLSFDIPEHQAEVHVKGAYVRGDRYFTIKVAGGFGGNPARGLPTNSGAVWVFDVQTGAPRAILFDNGLLTAVRTGAAGALATDLLAAEDVRTVTVIGAGEQARRQAEALMAVRRPRRLIVWARRPEEARRCAADIASNARGIAVDAEERLEAAVGAADVVITTTSSREPLVRAEWVRPGTHITAVGSDMAGKVELEPALLARALVVADRIDQCRTQGEIAASLDAGAISIEDVHGELGDVLIGRRPGRTHTDQITVADLTGVGATDATVATLVARCAIERGMGQRLETGR